jgi:hypothetical protein
MSSSSFINALRSFIALRGPVLELRSDRGTNFVGAAGELQLDSFSQENTPVTQYLNKSGINGHSIRPILLTKAVVGNV